MAIAAQTVIRLAVDQLLDITSIRWPADELVRYLNAGQREIVVHRPDALTVNASLTCAAGTKQSLPAAAMKLVNVIRNTNSPKRAVTKCERDYLDQSIQGWHNITGGTEVYHYMYDPMDPRVFYVYPPVTTSASLEICYTAMPTDVTEPAAGSTYTSVTGNIGVPDIYANCLVDYTIFRALSKNSKFVGDNQRALQYLANFGNSLGIELKTLVAAVQNASTNLNPNERGAVGASAIGG